MAIGDAGGSMLVARLGPALLAEIDAAARRAGLSRSAWVRLALAAAARPGARLGAP